MFAEEITATSRHDLLGTAMTAARVGAAVIANIRDDSDAPYVTSAMVNTDEAISQLVQALAETVVASRMRWEREDHAEVVRACEFYEDRIRQAFAA